MTWPEAPRKPLWEVIEEEGSYNFCPYAYTTREVLSFALCRVEWGNLPEVKVEHTNWPANLISYVYVDTASSLEKGETLMTYTLNGYLGTFVSIRGQLG